MSAIAAAEPARRGLAARLAGFLPAVLLSLLPLLHPHPALGAAPALAVPLYLMAAAGFLDPTDGISLLRRLSHLLRGGLWLGWTALIAFGAALAWPAQRLATRAADGGGAAGAGCGSSRSAGRR